MPQPGTRRTKTGTETILHFTVERRALVQELGLAALDGTETAQLLLRAHKGRLTLTAGTDDLCLTASIAADISGEGEAVVPLFPLLDHARQLDAETLSFELLPKRRLRVGGGPFRAELRTLDRSGMFDRFGVAERPARVPEHVLGSLLSKTVYAAACPEKADPMEGCLLVFAPGKITAVATDGHRLAKAEHELAAPARKTKDAAPQSGNQRFLLPGKAFKTLVKLLGPSAKDVLISSGDKKQMRFDIGERTLVVRQHVGVYPHFEKAIPTENTKEVDLPVGEFSQLLKVVAQWAAPWVEFHLEENSFTMRAGNPSRAEVEVALAVTYDGAPVTIRFDPDYLLEFLRLVEPEQRVRLSLRGEFFAALFRPITAPDRTSFLYVLMPIQPI